MTFWSCRENGLIKDKNNCKIRDVTTWLTNDSIHILPNISRSKGSQTLKLGQLIEYNKKYFSSKIMQKMGQGD